jgi:NAD(P)-dependent dehydrogenase (short-subunit alcohol dehydrogenase family)
VERAWVQSGSNEISFQELDVRDGSAVQACIDEIDSLDLLVNCAGVIRRNAEHEPEIFADVIDINLNGSMRVCTAAREKLKQRKGCIINTASMLSFFVGAWYQDIARAREELLN